MRVLVADDSGVVRKMIVRALDSIGVEDVCEAADGDEALKQFFSSHFDLVLTDWNMPGKNGLEVIKSIRSAGFAVPIIMVTTVEQQGDVQDAFEAGVTDYLTKPFEIEDLMVKIESLAIDA
jgi:two-component system, chemotaxis family, chemotaxis protein CheY